MFADVFENFRNKFIEIYELDTAHFFSAPELAWQFCLKMKEVKLELLTNIYILMIAYKGIRGGIVESVHKYAKANNKYMKNYDKNIKLSYLMHLDANNLYRWEILKSCLYMVLN